MADMIQYFEYCQAQENKAVLEKDPCAGMAHCDIVPESC